MLPSAMESSWDNLLEMHWAEGSGSFLAASLSAESTLSSLSSSSNPESAFSEFVWALLEDYVHFDCLQAVYLFQRLAVE